LKDTENRESRDLLKEIERENEILRRELQIKEQEVKKSERRIKYSKVGESSQESHKRVI